MSVPIDWQAILQAALAPTLIVTLLYNADKLLSTQASKDLSMAVSDVAAAPATSRWSVALDEFLEQNFPSPRQHGKFWQSVLVLTSLALLIVLAIYASRMTGLVQQLFTKGFLVQFLGVGLVTTFLVNAFAFSQYRHLLRSFVAQSALANVGWIVADLFAKALLFLLLTALLYVVFAKTGGAFHGDAIEALRRVPVTVHGAIRFENLTSVYIYSLALSSFPLHVAVVVKLMALHPRFARIVQRVFYFLPLAEKPLQGAAVIVAVFAGAFAMALALLIQPFN